MGTSKMELRGGIPKVQHESGWQIKPLRRHLLEAGANECMVSQLVDHQGIWNLQPNKVDLFELGDLDKMLSVAREELRDPYNCAQLSIVQAYWGLFNSHTWDDHIEPVARHATRFGVDAGLTDDNILDIGIAAAGHDLGNLQRRKIHSRFSPRLFARKFPRVVDQAPRWRAIADAMVLHDESVYSSMGLAGRPLNDRLAIMRNFGASAMSAALLIADKTDIGRRRVWYTACNERGMNEHPHSVINTAIQTTGVGIDSATGQFKFQMFFNPFVHDLIDEQKYREIRTFREEDGYGYYVSAPFREVDTDAQSPISFEKTWRQFLKLYGPSKQRTATSRLELAVDNIYLLYPGVDEVSIEFSSAKNHGHGRNLRFSRDSVDEIWETIANGDYY